MKSTAIKYWRNYKTNLNIGFTVGYKHGKNNRKNRITSNVGKSNEGT